MNAPKARHIAFGRDPDAGLKDLQERFAAIGRRHDRRVRLRKAARRLGFFTLAAFGVLAVVSVMLTFSSWTWTTTLRHAAASLNCDTARSVGLAPSIRGAPGYWPWLDADADGQSCEPNRLYHERDGGGANRPGHRIITIR